MSTPRVLGICGSLRVDSHNRRLLEAATDALPHADWAIARLRGIPAYDADIEARGLPPAVVQLKDQIGDADAIVIATPEYNHSIPGVLKNAIDWASRPAMRSPFVGKPVLMMGASPGRGGAQRALAHLRQVLESMEARPMDDVVSVPEVRRRFHDARPDAELDAELRQALTQLGLPSPHPIR
ncbi:MAG: NAD(P)H-dependent oxidoreductase [Chloroflexi bacterium]|nr:NAD(P)H-dependent oxidoreductase [Chloroflexota bacterium]